MRWATRVATLGAQVSWLLLVGGLIGALFVVPKVRLHPPDMQMPNTATVLQRGDDTCVYEFTLDGVTYQKSGVYYGTAPVGGLIRIWYDPRDPHNSTTLSDVGDRIYDYGPGSLSVLAAPLAALVLVICMMWRSRRFRLLRYGRLVEGRVARTEETAGGRVAFVTYRYDIAGTEHRAEITTVRPAGERPGEPVLYDPADPYHACAIEDLTGRPHLEGDRFVPTTLPYAAFVLPVTALALVAVLLVKSL